MKLIKESFIILSLLSTVIQPRAFADATSEKPDQQSYDLKRSAQTPSSVQFTLSKNVYRQEPYQAEYTVQIPYTEEEQYTEQIPYDETEAYTDYETYYDSEYQCHNETSYRQECHTRNVCNLWDDRPGRYPDNDGGRPGRYPDNDGGRGGDHDGDDRGRSCRDEQYCENEPYTTNVCGYVSVPKTREVTKYRTVTRYREEQRTRTVTKYRSESRCCETRYKDVYDHQNSYSVTVKLPEVSLGDNEIETLSFELQGDEKTPQIALELGDTVYSYAIAKQQFTGANAEVELVTVPKYDKTNAGLDSISNLALLKQGTVHALTFVDQMTDSHVKNSYAVKVKDVKGAALAASVSAIRKGTQVIVTLDHDLSGKGPVVVELGVRRESPLIKDNALSITVFKGLVVK